MECPYTGKFIEDKKEDKLYKGRYLVNYDSQDGDIFAST